MTTPAQIEANRRNAQKSTGPKTAQGRAVVSLNGLRHGLRAETAVLPFEDPAEFAKLKQELQAEFRPQTLRRQPAIVAQPAQKQERMGLVVQPSNQPRFIMSDGAAERSGYQCEAPRGSSEPSR